MSFWKLWNLIRIEKGIDQAVKCPHCGKLLKKRSNKCVYCKKDPSISLKVGEYKVQKVECPKCKALNEPGAVTCISCGINFIDHEMTKSKDFSGIKGARERRKYS